MESCSSSLISKYCLVIFTVCFSLLFSLRIFEERTYFTKPRGEVFLLNSFKSIVNIDGISLMFETLIIRSQMKATNRRQISKLFDISSPVHRLSFWETNFKRRTFSVSSRRFWTMKLGEEPVTNLYTQVGTKL